MHTNKDNTFSQLCFVPSCGCQCLRTFITHERTDALESLHPRAYYSLAMKRKNKYNSYQHLKKYNTHSQITEDANT